MPAQSAQSCSAEGERPGTKPLGAAMTTEAAVRQGPQTDPSGQWTRVFATIAPVAQVAVRLADGAGSAANVLQILQVVFA